jgi:hypothetical protein
MSDDRLARALLRLYPRAWRARYGDEFLALVADTGLSWRTLADVSSAALVERARAIAGPSSGRAILSSPASLFRLAPSASR